MIVARDKSVNLEAPSSYSAIVRVVDCARTLLEKGLMKMNDKSEWYTGFDSSQAKQYEFLAVNNTWHFFVISLSVWSLMRCREAMQSQKPRHRSDPHRNGVLTLTAQSKGQTDVTGMWEGTREGGQDTKLLKNKNKNHWETGCFLGICLKSLLTPYVFNIPLSFLSLSSCPTTKRSQPWSSVSTGFLPFKSKWSNSFILASQLEGKRSWLDYEWCSLKDTSSYSPEFIPCWNTGSKMSRVRPESINNTTSYPNAFDISREKKWFCSLVSL